MKKISIENAVVKKIICYALVIMMLVMSISGNISSAQGKTDYQIADELKNLKILIGNENGINLDSNITRNEMIVLLTRLLGDEENISKYKNIQLPFDDVDSWANLYIKYAYNNGITKGTGGNKFLGKRNVSMNEVDTFLIRALGYDDDIKEYSSAIEVGNNLGINKGINIDNTNNSNSIVSRRQLNKMVQNTINMKKKNSNMTILEEIRERLKLAGKNIVGYLPTWTGDYYKSVDYSLLTHVNIAFANPDSNGNIKCDFDIGKMKEIAKLAHVKDAKVLISLGGGNNAANYLKLTSDYGKMQNFNKNIISFALSSGIDGIDIDVEGDVEKSFWNNYDRWISDLKSRCNEEGLLLTTAAGKWYAQNISDSTFSKFDLVNIMAYDNNVDASNHSTYIYAKECLEYFENRGIDKEKLVLGVPFYGYSYNSNGTMNWKSAKTYASLISKNESAIDSDNSNGYGYNGISTIIKKCELSSNYGGIMIWSINQDAKGDNSLLLAISKKVK